MPKNKGKGGDKKRRGKNEREVVNREILLKEDGQEYARVEKILGNSRITADCLDGKKRLCVIRGKLRKKVWIIQGDIVLIGLRDFEDGKADVIHKFSADEARKLKAMGEIPDSVAIEETADIVFDESANAETGEAAEYISDISDEDEDSEEDEEEEASNNLYKAPSRNVKFNRKDRGTKRNDNYIDDI